MVIAFILALFWVSNSRYSGFVICNMNEEVSEHAGNGKRPREDIKEETEDDQKRKKLREEDVTSTDIVCGIVNDLVNQVQVVTVNNEKVEGNNGTASSEVVGENKQDKVEQNGPPEMVST